MIRIECVRRFSLRLFTFGTAIVKRFVLLITDDLILEIWVKKLRASIASQHINDQYLTPFVDVNQEIAELAEVFVDELDALGADLKDKLINFII